MNKELKLLLYRGIIDDTQEERQQCLMKVNHIVI